jgi:hypothetical protein
VDGDADLLRVTAERSSQIVESTGRIKNPRVLAGHLRRAQTFLRALGVEIAFSREGRAGTRVIRIRRSVENNVSNVSSVSWICDGVSQPALEKADLDPSGTASDHNYSSGFAPDLEALSMAAD